MIALIESIMVYARTPIDMKRTLFTTLLACVMSCTAFAAPLPMPFSNDGKAHEFSVDDHNFLMDGKAVKIISGEIHYPRVPREHWRDRLQKIKAMGMNTVCTYLFWNLHEKTPGQWDFSGNLDVAEFCRIAQEEGLWVIVRPGPYVCAEWEFGGFPGWLLKEEDTEVRSLDPRFLKPAMAYLERVCKELAPLQVSKGGPIIMAQVENEYGSFGSDKVYMNHHLDAIKKGLPGVLPFTSDGPNDSMINGGTLPGIVPAMNFGGGAEGAFKNLRKHRPNTPLMNGEFWVGWFDHWGKPKNARSTESYNNNLKWMLENNVSPNLFMAHGGTSFGFMNGANWVGGAYAPDVTNYDYGSPINESGRLNERFEAFRKTIQEYYGDTYELPAPPAEQEFMTLPAIRFNEMSGMFAQLPKAVESKKAVHMEALGQSLGFILYRTKVKGPLSGKLDLEKMQDRTHVYLDGKRVATMDRRYSQKSCDIDIPAGEHTLDLFVENMGRINFGRQLLDERKGIRGAVTIGKKEITDFAIYNLPCDDLSGLQFSTTAPKGDQPVFYRSTFNLTDVKDTYLDMRKGWKKGNVWVNGHNLGRFWFIGSQQSLYCPLSFLKKGENEIIVLDIDGGKGTIEGITEAVYGVQEDPNASSIYMHGKPVYPKKDQLAKSGSFANSANWEEVRFSSPQTARYVAIESLNAHDGGRHASITELVFVDDKGKALNREDLSVVYADSQEVVGEDAQAGFVMDNQPTTYWHTRWDGDKPDHPHMIVIDLGKERKISGFNYQPRQDKENGRIKDYNIYVSKKPFSRNK